MTAFRVLRRLRDLLDVDTSSASAGDALVLDVDGVTWVPGTSGGGGAPSGAAGGVLGGTYPNPSFAADMATQAELDAHVNDATAAHAASAISNTPAGSIASTTVQAAIDELASDVGSIPTDYVAKALFDANTILKADSDNTPAALTMGASTILARLAAGNIVAATPSELRTLLALVIGTNVQAYDADLTTWAGLTPSAYFQTLVDDATAAAARTTLGVTEAGWFGDGADGTVTFDGTTTILGMVPSASEYTLTRDFFLQDCTINNGVLIKTAGFRIFVLGTLTNNGTIHWNGISVGNSATAGAALSNANSTINVSASTSRSPGLAGGAGGATTGSAATNAATSLVYTAGGGGGTGGTGTGGAGGSGSTVFQPVAFLFKTATMAVIATIISSNGGQWLPPQGGTGGGGGGGDTSVSGGGGGGGGGFVFLFARFIAGTGGIQAKGGNGGTRNTGNVGGGGGGGGGCVVVLSESVVSGAISGQTVNVAGGTKGSPNGSGTDNAVNGGNGNSYLIAAV